MINIQASAINHEKGKSSPSKHSDDTVDSQICLPFAARRWGDVKQKLQSIGWIQCENINCRKWRKCPRKELDNISDKDKWYCRQNTDPQFSSCEAPEEDTEFYDRLAVRSGLIYLKSELKPGDLVWARMSGYCRWPALVSKDPATGSATWSEELEDGEGQISHYHVEFLGQPHSHSWVCARHVSAFTLNSATECSPAALQQNMKNAQVKKLLSTSGRKRGRPRLKAALKQPKIKTTYRNGVTVAKGIEEAVKLLPLSPRQRLQHCTYLCQESVTSHNLESPRQAKKIIKCSSRCKDKVESQSTEKSQSVGCGRKQIRDSQTRSKQAMKKPATSTPSAVTLGYATFCTSLNTSTKEERLLLDTEMYKRNERAFDHDVTRFMLRNGLKMMKGPFWQNQRISLFQLFLAVHERGGYLQVTDRRGWAAVYREVTDLACSGDFSYSSAARNFYYRYLYPYELYIQGKDFKAHMDVEAKMGRREGDKMGSRRHQPMKTKSTAMSSSINTGAAMTEVKREDDVASESLLEMLDALEENSKIDLEEPVNIIFHDDSTPSTKDFLPLIHHGANYATDSFHAVPSIDCQRKKSESAKLVSTADSFHAVPSLNCQREASDSAEHIRENVFSSRQGKVNNRSDKGVDGFLDLHHTKETVINHETGGEEIDGNESDQGSSACSRVLLHQLQVLQDSINFIEEQLI